jgi:hypothetical protein
VSSGGLFYWGGFTLKCLGWQNLVRKEKLCDEVAKIDNMLINEMIEWALCIVIMKSMHVGEFMFVCLISETSERILVKFGV